LRWCYDEGKEGSVEREYDDNDAGFDTVVYTKVQYLLFFTPGPTRGFISHLIRH